MFGDDPFSGVGSAVEVAAGVDRSGWSGAAKSAGGARAAGRRRSAWPRWWLAVVGDWDADQSWALDGSLSPVAWLAHRAPLTRQERVDVVRTARHVEANEQTAKALDVGDITAAHAEIAAQAAKHREELYAEHEDMILDAARSARPVGVPQVMQHWRSCATTRRTTRTRRTSSSATTSTSTRPSRVSGISTAASTRSLTASMIRVSTAWNPPTPSTGSPRPAPSPAAAPMRWPG